MEWIYPRISGIMWNVWSLEVYSSNVKKVRLFRMRKKGYYNLDLTQIPQNPQIFLLEQKQ